MEEIQTGENDFFDEFDKFACTQEVFDLIKSALLRKCAPIFLL